MVPSDGGAAFYHEIGIMVNEEGDIVALLGFFMDSRYALFFRNLRSMRGV